MHTKSVGASAVVLSVAELSEELDIPERDVIDLANQAGCDEFRLDNETLDYIDIDKYHWCDHNGWSRVPDYGEIEIVMNEGMLDRFEWLTGESVWSR